MMRHLLKLAWHRKRANALVCLEILVSFLVLFVVVTLGTWFFHLHGLPLGYEWRDVWNVAVQAGASDDSPPQPGDAEAFERALREVRGLEGVTAAAGAFVAPYDNGTMLTTFNLDGRIVETEIDDITDEFAAVMGIRMTEGRWFEPGDASMSWNPVVVNEAFVASMFPGENALGKALPRDPEDAESRVIGVVREFRKGGELAIPGSFMFRRVAPGGGARVPRNIVLKVQAGAGTGLEQRVLERLRGVAPTWSFEIRRLEDMRAESIRQYLTPLAIGALVGAFLLLMVGLGLVGVMWQNVTRRTCEIGLRRAAGATAAEIRRQIILEVWVTTTASLLLGVTILAQLPVLGLSRYLPPGVFAAGLAISLVSMYLLTLLCGYYPSWMATLVQPAEALRSE
jgi:putative ABC transport system permease protein